LEFHVDLLVMPRFANCKGAAIASIVQRRERAMIHFVSGKGGVGKSAVAAALGWHLANSGRRTLLIELGEHSYFRHIFQQEISSQPIQMHSHLSVVRWDGETCLREYIHHLVKIERMVKLFFDNRIMKALVQAAPALKELALLGKITSGVRRIGPALPFDDLVVDGYATGHFRALWRAPIGLGEAIPIGPMGEQSRSIVRVMRDPALTKFHVVLIPEDLPVTEGLELARDIQSEMDQRPQLVFNRWLDSPLTIEQLQKFRGHEFADFVNLQLERQNALLRDVELRDLPIQKLPWVLHPNIPEQVRVLSNHWGAKL
jgi:anion-transporting  ArsA/GET3 family ATPase